MTEAAEFPKRGFESERANGLLEDNHFSDIGGAVHAAKGADAVFSVDALDGLPQLHESTGSELAQNRERYNLRKSLAWDSAFFTSAGVLDPEELSIMIIRADKPEKRTLCGIQEEVAGSIDSFSTLGSDTLTLEALEDDLFIDVRASIQRSNWEPPNSTSSHSMKDTKDTDFPANSAVKESLASQNKIQKPFMKKGSSAPSARIVKSQPSQNVGKLVHGKQIKQGAANLSTAQPGGRSVEKNPIVPRVSKGINSSVPTATATSKRQPAATAHAKSECGSPKHAPPSGKATLQPKGSIMSGLRRVLPKPAVPPKSSLLSSSTSKSLQSLRSSTSSDGYSNMHSVPQGSFSKSSSSCPKAPSRARLNNKQSFTAVSTNVKSTMISSAPSPASSISEWSSASSCSTSVTNHTSDISRASIDGKSVRGDLVLDRLSRSAGRTGDRLKNQEGSNSSKRSVPPQTAITHASVKPSGLRMPSPKIGFFDGVKSSARTPNRHQQSQSRLRKAPSKITAVTSSPSGSSNAKSNIRYTSPATSVISSSSKLDSPCLSLGVCSNGVELKLNEVASSLMKEETHFNISFKEISEASLEQNSCLEYFDLNLIEKKSAISIGESSPKMKKVMAENMEKIMVDADISAVTKEDISNEVIGEGSFKGSDSSAWKKRSDQTQEVLVNQSFIEKNCPASEAAAVTVLPNIYSENDLPCEVLSHGSDEPIPLVPSASGIPLVLQNPVCDYASNFGMADETHPPSPQLPYEVLSHGPGELTPLVPSASGIPSVLQNPVCDYASNVRVQDETHQPSPRRWKLDSKSSSFSTAMTSMANLDSSRITSPSSLPVGACSNEAGEDCQKSKEVVDEVGITKMMMEAAPFEQSTEYTDDKSPVKHEEEESLKNRDDNDTVQDFKRSSCAPPRSNRTKCCPVSPSTAASVSPDSRTPLAPVNE